MSETQALSLGKFDLYNIQLAFVGVGSKLITGGIGLT
jgi:hypothetical protein